MSEDNEWKEIKDTLESNDAEIIEKYGIDIRKKFMDITNKENILKKKRKKLIIKNICVLLAIILIMYLMCYFNSYNNQVRILKQLDSYSMNNIEFVSSDTNFFGDGFFEYKSKAINNNVIHAYIDNKVYGDDINERYCKYFFETWEDKDKNLFKVVETYTDYTVGWNTKKGWLLNYDLYLYANTMEELLYETEACIRFLEYMNQPTILVNCYIQMEDKLIRPITASGQDSELVRKNVIYQYYNPVFNT